MPGDIPGLPYACFSSWHDASLSPCSHCNRAVSVPMPFLQCVHSSNCISCNRQYLQGCAPTVLSTRKQPCRSRRQSLHFAHWFQRSRQQRGCGRAVAAHSQQDDTSNASTSEQRPGPAAALPTLLDGVNWCVETEPVLKPRTWCHHATLADMSKWLGP